MSDIEEMGGEGKIMIWLMTYNPSVSVMPILQAESRQREVDRGVCYWEKGG